MTEMERSPPLMGSIMASKLLLKNNHALISMTGSANVCVRDKKKPFCLYKDNTVQYLHVKI